MSGAQDSRLRTAALTPATWDDFAALTKAHNGVWGGCWCMAFHPEGMGRAPDAEANRAAKQARVHAGTAQAALVYDADACVGWAQFGPAADLPRIKSARAYAAGLGALPDWRITCFFVARDHRRRGVARAALTGALDLIAAAGGGQVEAYPEATTGRKAVAAFLYSGPLEMFEAAGFSRDRQIGKDRWVVRRLIPSASA